MYRLTLVSAVIYSYNKTN